ncbi:hypothetical protein NKR23_g12149 [Pleurostoma richardsiae]|uniref:Uncharacterized protein n=1 Tax=Pleurostoma richardsiae TaxID=41990 RepID=A0AA38RH72_9PEZI|nr:hypothetical protein NKR23_g12149 [Pleurostoma richardsiae]
MYSPVAEHFHEPGEQVLQQTASTSALMVVAAPPPQSPGGVTMLEQLLDAALIKAFNDYEAGLKDVFSLITCGALRKAADVLLSLSDWLLSHVKELGLTSDVESMHQERLELWNNFNHCWLALFQAQKDLFDSNLRPGQELISRDRLKDMGNELVHLNDTIEQHGLVDYQYGVWEEQIIDVLEECCDILDEALGEAEAVGSRLR